MNDAVLAEELRMSREANALLRLQVAAAGDLIERLVGESARRELREFILTVHLAERPDWNDLDAAHFLLNNEVLRSSRLQPIARAAAELLRAPEMALMRRYSPRAWRRLEDALSMAGGDLHGPPVQGQDGA